MRCVIPGKHVKLFGKSVQCLAKIGSELYLEGETDSLALRTVNSSRSAFGCVTFHESFFQSYSCGGGSRHQGQRASGPAADSADSDNAGLEDDSVRCKIAAKSCLSVFRSLASLEKTVDQCRIDLDVAASKLTFVLHCKHGITKTYNLGFQECESLQAIFSKDLSVNVITSPAKLLQEVVANFLTSQEEITMGVLATQLTFRNYVDDDPDPSKALLTETSLDPDEFDHYCVGVEASLTFCLKELRAILGFLEAAQQNVTMHFESGGKPLVFCIDSDVAYTADFVLATLLETMAHPSAVATATTAAAAPAGESYATGMATAAGDTPSRNLPPSVVASQSLATQNSSTAVTRANNVPSVPERLTTARSQKRCTTSSTSTVSHVEWPEEGFPKRVRRPYDDSQLSSDAGHSASSSVIPPSTQPAQQSMRTTSAMATTSTAAFGGGGDDVVDDDYDHFAAPGSDSYNDLGSESNAASLELPRPSPQDVVLVPSSAASASGGGDRAYPGTAFANRPPSSWLRSQEHHSFNALETPRSAPQFSLSESSDMTPSNSERQYSMAESDIVLNSPNLEAAPQSSRQAPFYNQSQSAAPNGASAQFLASSTAASESIVAGTIPVDNRHGNGNAAAPLDLSAAVADHDATADLSDVMVDNTIAMDTGGGMATSSGYLDNTIVATVRSQSPSTRQYCALFFGGIPDNFARSPAMGVEDEEVLAEDTDGED